MVELAPSDSPNSLRRGFAGDVFNTLYYARLLMPADWKVGFHTAFGTDSLSDDMMAFIARQNIDCLNTPRIEGGSPGLYMIHLRDGERSFSYWRNASAARQLMREPDLLAAKLVAAQFIYLSGITLAILSTADRQLLLKMVAQVRGADRTVFFDSNLRSGGCGGDASSSRRRELSPILSYRASMMKNAALATLMRTRLLTVIGGGARKRSSSRMVWHLPCWWMRMMPSGLPRRRFIRRLTARPLAMPSMAA